MNKAGACAYITRLNMIKWLPLTSLLGLAQNDGQGERAAMLSNFIELKRLTLSFVQ